MLHRTTTGCCEKKLTWKETREGKSCTHGQTFHYAKGIKATTKETPKRKRSSMKRSQPKRDWKDARRKVEEEGACRVCGSNESLEAAHIIGRASDGPNGHRSSKPLWVNPDSILPLCGSFSQMQCHARYDAHDLDVLQFLTPAEQVQAVKDAGGIEAARMRTSPSSYRVLREAA